MCLTSWHTVEKQLARLNPRKATGSDEIPAWVVPVLRDFAPFLSGPLFAVFNSSIREGFVPDLWKTALWQPCPRLLIWHPCPRESHRNRSSPNLCPISLVPIASKLLEHFACKWAREAVAPKHPSEAVRRSERQLHHARPCRDAAPHPVQPGYNGPICSHASSRIL